jgi:hypothetical protein
MKKQGIEWQVNWIFVLIAGAVILAFFFGIVQKQRSLSEQKLSITLASQMDAIYAGAIESRGTAQPLSTPQPGIAFSCSSVCECNFIIGRKTTEFRDKLLFAPPIIKDGDAWVWASEWKMPFRTANFLMLSSPAVTYYIIYDAGSPLSEQLYRRLSKNLPKEIPMRAFSSIGAVGQVSLPGTEYTRIIFAGIEPASHSTLGLSTVFSEEKVSGVYLDPDLRRAVFYEKEPDELRFNSVPAILAGEASVYAAMFASDKTMYDCIMKRAFSHLERSARISVERSKILQEETTALGELQCAYVLQDLESLAQSAKTLSVGGTFSEQETARDTLLRAQSEIQRQNDLLARQSCPVIY